MGSLKFTLKLKSHYSEISHLNAWNEDLAFFFSQALCLGSESYEHNKKCFVTVFLDTTGFPGSRALQGVQSYGKIFTPCEVT